LHPLIVGNRLAVTSPGSPRRIDLFAFYATIVLIAAFGGSSRHDLVQAAILQPLLWLALGIAVWRASELRWFARPLLLVVAFGAWLALQLVPLPFAVWSQLGGREPIADVDRQLIGEIWRPLSLAPSRTLNAISYLPALLAPMIAAINLGPALARHVLFAIIGTAVLSASIGLLQEFSGSLYFYSITNQGRMVGLFANANHAAVFGSLAIALAGSAMLGMPKGWERSLVTAAAAFLFLVMLVNGSRAGLATLLIAVAAFLICASFSARAEMRGVVMTMWADNRWRVWSVVTIALAMGLFATALLMSDRIPALKNMIADDPLGDLRFQVFPVLLGMVQTYFPWGTGIGAFEKAYQISEPVELLGHNYLNMAHNDLLQFVIEGGVAGLVFAAALLLVIGRAARHAMMLQNRSIGASVLSGLLAIGMILGIGSAFDYPLRTPIFQSAIAMLLILLHSWSTLGCNVDPR
jgi:O-antigen ligase